MSRSAEHRLRLRIGIHLEMNLNRLIQKEIITTSCLTFALSLSSRLGGAGDILLALLAFKNSEFEFDSVSVHNVGVLVHVCTHTTLYLSVRCDPEWINSKI